MLRRAALALPLAAALLLAGPEARAQAVVQGAAQGGAQGAAPGAFTPEQRAEIVGILREALRTDPSLLREAIEAMRNADQAEQATAQRNAIAANADALFRNADDPVKGNPRGDVTLVEFFDARCGYCKQLQPAMAELLKRDPNIRVVLKDIPILGPNSVLASRALLAAQKQGKYEALHTALLALRGDATEAAIQAEAQRVGIDWPRLKRDMEDPSIQARIASNLRLAQALEIQGTPALVIGDTLVPGAVDLATLEKLVAEARRRG
ncbi:DsbA family protein [Roseomonas sp. OT10]|uniref:DsbA family protein n=1 Tax=Roseomonas cutis TaxID=2897332 RepID=UPI001E642090|nr:DsbA family protein [Roseomonas sp. OT10]UFN49422.1 DsbA family protein [Roseomonas sp. OT10]